MENKKYKGIQEYLLENDLLKYATDEVVSIFPIAENCNYSLIEGLFCLKVINED